jgi:hypothetical protein
MLSVDKITEIFVSVDDFCKHFDPFLNKKLIGKPKLRNKPSQLAMSEVMTIQIAFHHSGFRTFKDFYLGYVCKHLKNLFPNTVSIGKLWGKLFGDKGYISKELFTDLFGKG